jgi:hypothetical protein
MRAAPALVLLCLVASGCAVLPLSLRVPADREATLVLGSVPLGEPISRVARHAFFLARRAGETQWRAYEVGGGARVRHVSDGDVVSHWSTPSVHKVWRGAQATAFIDCLQQKAGPLREWANENYRFYPGPNSNTYVDTLLRECKIHAVLPPTCVGRDWRGAVGASVTTSGTGVQLETPIVGLRIGLTDGIEFHLFGLAFGIDFWPPALIVPFGEGRIGFADR